MRLRGSFLVFQLFDVAEAIRLDALRLMLKLEPAGSEYLPGQGAPGYLRFEPPPLVAPAGEIDLPGAGRFTAEIHYYAYGVVCLRFVHPFEGDWPDLIQLAARSVAAPEMETAARACLAPHLAAAQAAFEKPYGPEVTEDYVIARIDPIEEDGAFLTGAQVLHRHGGVIAQLVRGEAVELAAEERDHILASRISYYPADLVVAGWSAAFVYDTRTGADTGIQLIEYANTQLIEFRFYDQMLTGVLAQMYRVLDEGTGLWRRWRLAKEADRLNTVRLDVQELTERIDNTVKFLSDMYSARFYQLAAVKVGVPDYRRLVDEKLNTAAELYRFMTERVHQSSALLLETTVVIILLIELVYLFRGKA